MRCRECGKPLIPSVTPHLWTCPDGHGRLVHEHNSSVGEIREFLRENPGSTRRQVWRRFCGMSEPMATFDALVAGWTVIEVAGERKGKPTYRWREDTR